MFLTDRDYAAHAKDYDLNILTKGGQTAPRIFAEAATIEQMKSALRLEFEADEAFIDITLWNSATTYNENDHVEHDVGGGDVRTFYALQANTNSTPVVGGSVDWTEGDLRNKQLVMLALDISMFHMFTKIPQRQTPKNVEDRYLDAVEWLKAVASGKMIPNLPRIVRSEESGNLFYGGKNRVGFDWQSDFNTEDDENLNN